MIEIIYSPTWFYGKDILIDLISLGVLLLIALFSIRFYRLNLNRNYIKLSFSFLLLGLAFLFKILMNFTIYYRSIETKHYVFFKLTYETIKSSDALFYIGSLLYRLLTLYGLFILYTIYQKQTKPNFFLISCLIFISTFFTRSSYYVFFIASFALLMLITLQYSDKYTKNKYKGTKLLCISFSIISVSQLLFIFVRLSSILYPVSEIVQLLGYIILLFTFTTVLKLGKEKKDKN